MHALAVDLGGDALIRQRGVEREPGANRRMRRDLDRQRGHRAFFVDAQRARRRRQHAAGAVGHPQLVARALGVDADRLELACDRAGRGCEETAPAA